MKLPLKEPLSARYLYLSPENIVHIFMPIVSGTNIGLDNTCKAVYALQEFFDKGNNSNKKASLKAELLAYKEAVESDISILEPDSALTQQKEERLAQIEAYLKVLGVVEQHEELNCLNSGFPSYPRPLEGMIQDRATSNLYSMVLRPSQEDGFLRTEGANPVFSVAHKSVSRQIDEVESALQKALINKYRPLTFNVRDLKAEVKHQVLTQFEALNQPCTSDLMAKLLQEAIQAQLHVTVDFSKTDKGEAITDDLITTTMLSNSPEDYVDALLGFCANEVFTTVPISPFKYLIRAEDWSIATQFLLGMTNLYAVAKGKTSQDTNFGDILDKNPDLSKSLVETLAEAQRAGNDIEEVAVSWMNAHAPELKLNENFSPNDLKTIQQNVANRYAQIKDSPHFDEFFVLDTEKEGRFVMHQGSICTGFAEFVSSPLLEVPQELTQPLEQARTQAPGLSINIPHKNILVHNDVEINTATLDKAALQALYECIDSYQDQKLKEMLLAQLKQERPDFKPKINAKPFLQCVAYGQQNEAESLLKKDAELAQALLTARGIAFTDYSGRTFKCSAYEYAWWAKDSHMRFMLEQYMSDETKQELLKRVRHIEEPIGEELFKQPRGLAYTQQGHKYRSAHFNLTPLKIALRAYIDAYNQSPKRTDADWEALDLVWIRVDLPQREVPAHIAHEYCHPMRSFQDAVNNPSLLDASNPNNLKRSLKFYNWNTGSSDDWFTPTISCEDSGLGSLFAILRGNGWAARGGGRGGDDVAWYAAKVDLPAIEAIDEARTTDLTRSLEYLAAPSSLQAPRIHGN
ncbi:MAG: SidC [Legionella sp.]|nr:SidC [Legionella sp.]